MTRAVNLANLADSTISVDNVNDFVGIGSTQPSTKLDVVGVVSATSFSGDGSQLSGIDASTLKSGGAVKAQANGSGIVVTGVATATGFSGNLTGNVTGNVTGNASGTAGGLTGTPNIVVGSVQGTTGTFSGNVSVGGTLTYDDVNNIDSVGIITANSGIQVSGIVTAKAGAAVTYYGDGSNLTGIDAAPSMTAVADGSISNGKTVILQSNGTVKAITKTVSSTTPIAGPEKNPNTSSVTYTSVAYDSTNSKFVMIFRDGQQSGKGTAFVGDVDINSRVISFGTGTQYTQNNTYNQKVCYDKASGKVIVAFQNASMSNYLFVIAGEISGNSITFGTQQQVPGNAIVGQWDFDLVYDESAERTVVFYCNQNNNERLTYCVMQLTGTTFTFGSPTVVDSSDCEAVSAAYDSGNQRVVAVYEDDGDSSTPHVFVGTVDPSNNSISGNESQLHSTSVSDEGSSLVYDASAGKFIATHRITTGGNNTYGMSKVFTVNPGNNTFTAGNSLVTFNNNSSTYFSGAYDPSTQKSIIACRNSSNNIITKVGTVSGSGTNATITYANPLDLGAGFYTDAAYVAHAQQIVFTYADSGSGDYPHARTYSTVQSTSNLSQENFIGFSNAAYTNGQTAKIQLVGAIDDAQTGLTTARKYYVQPDGTISLDKYDNPPIYAGISKSATEIIIKG